MEKRSHKYLKQALPFPTSIQQAHLQTASQIKTNNNSTFQYKIKFNNSTRRWTHGNNQVKINTETHKNPIFMRETQTRRNMLLLLLLLRVTARRPEGGPRPTPHVPSLLPWSPLLPTHLSHPSSPSSLTQYINKKRLKLSINNKPTKKKHFFSQITKTYN